MKKMYLNLFVSLIAHVKEDQVLIPINVSILRDRLHPALDTLTDIQRMVIRRCFLQNPPSTLKECSEILGMSASAVFSHKERAIYNMLIYTKKHNLDLSALVRPAVSKS